MNYHFIYINIILLDIFSITKKSSCIKKAVSLYNCLMYLKYFFYLLFLQTVIIFKHQN